VHLLELGLVTAVIYHSLNGLKITLIDLFPSLAGHIKALGRTTVLLFVLCMIPVVAIMGKQTLDLL
jgi:succinate dehydrogenase/fumarate reductase cytochrome b subunit